MKGKVDNCTPMQKAWHVKFRDCPEMVVYANDASEATNKAKKVVVTMIVRLMTDSAQFSIEHVR